MRPALTDVVVELGFEGNPTTAALTADPRGPNGFAYSPNVYPPGLRGTVRSRIDGADAGDPSLRSEPERTELVR